MCGIIGIISQTQVGERIIEGLRRLEYRGYDSAGIATLAQGVITRRRASGKLKLLETKLAQEPLAGTLGIGHTRWATHGGPTETNAHPHANSQVAVVHNGIIENFQEIKLELQGAGYHFESETDTEIVVHLISQAMAQGLAPVEAAKACFARLRGAFALLVMFEGEPSLLVGIRNGTPLALGVGEGEIFLASDAVALAPFSNRIVYLADGDMVIAGLGNYEIFDAQAKQVNRPVRISNLNAAMIGKGDFRHFMQKEIHEQPEVIADTLASFLHPAAGQVQFAPLPFEAAELTRLTIVGCGTAYLAGVVARYWLEEIAGVAVDIDIASEFRYRHVPLTPGGVALFISQSGETLDTLEALRHCQRQQQKTIAIVNVLESTIARTADAAFYTLAGPEIGVASTKAFTTQLVVLACFTLAIARAKGRLTRDREAELVRALREVPAAMAQILRLDPRIEQMARDHLAGVRDVLYLGRGIMYPLALEGALKLKEISYIHAEAYAAGELKHGPIALIDDQVPAVMLAPSGDLFDKMSGNIQEVAARGGRVILFSDRPGLAQIGHLAAAYLELPKLHPFITPLLYALPMQLLAYHVAVLKGTDVDQPRNLAKAVTVE
jgi:glutamine---fructose-6-phosphate transaminase (isomerizing)